MAASALGFSSDERSPGWVPDQDGFHLCRTQAFARDLDRVVGAPEHVPEAILRIDVGPVSMDPDVLESAPVRLEVPLAISPEASRHPRPRVPYHQLAYLAADRLAVGVEHIDGHPRHWAGERGRAQMRDHVAAQDAA